MEIIDKKRFVIFIMLILSSSAIFSMESRNLLTKNYSRKYVNYYLTKDYSWVKYPSYNDRTSWSQIPQEIRDKTIEKGEEYLNYDWPATTATMYLEFTRTGNRGIVDDAIRKRLDALQSLVLAELMEGEKRFLDDIINGVFTICEQTFWGASAHFYLYGFNTSEGTINKPYTILPDIEDPIIDLMAGDVASDLAWTWYFFHNEFDKISPIISKRIKKEIQSKILDPYYERYDLWWIVGWGAGDRLFEWNKWTMNNWTAWCTYNMLTCIMLMEDDPEKKANGVYKTMTSMDLFMDTYLDDGVCDEGPGYWRQAGGKLFEYLDLLKKSTNGEINIFENDLIRKIGQFIYRVYISNGEHYINFASAGQQIEHNPGHIFRFGEAIDDPGMKEFGAFLLNRSNFGKEAVIGKLGETLENLFNLGEWQNTKISEPLISEYYFPQSELALARESEGSTDGFYFAAWGGHNGGGHSHPDVGSCILYFNGNPVLIDIGRGSSRSVMHNVPFINGIAQTTGGIYKANNSKFSSSRKKVFFSTDIAGAYPREAKVKKWNRSYKLERGKKFTIQDNFQLEQNLGNTKLHFMTELKGRITQPGILELSGNGFILNIRYNPSQLSATIEEKVLNDEISRLVFDFKTDSLSGNILLEIFEVRSP